MRSHQEEGVTQIRPPVTKRTPKSLIYGWPLANKPLPNVAFETINSIEMYLVVCELHCHRYTQPQNYRSFYQGFKITREL